MSFGMMIAQGQGQGQGPPPCDEWLNSEMAHDMNGDGTVDENDCPQQGPDPFQQAFMTTMQNGGTPEEAFEAVAAVYHQMDVECDDCEMTEEEFQELWKEMLNNRLPKDVLWGDLMMESDEDD